MPNHDGQISWVGCWAAVLHHIVPVLCTCGCAAETRVCTLIASFVFRGNGVSVNSNSKRVCAVSIKKGGSRMKSLSKGPHLKKSLCKYSE